MLYTLQDMLDSVGRKLNGSGVDPTCEPGKSQALEGFNRATRLLMLEDKVFVDGYVCVPFDRGTITLDRRIKEIISAKTPYRNAMPVFSQGIRFIDNVEYEREDGLSCHQSLEYVGSNFPTQRDLDKPRVIFATSDRPEAASSSLLVIGFDEEGKELRTTSADASVPLSKGISSTILMSTCDTPPQFNCGDGFHRGLVSAITALRKPRTNGYVSVWGLDEMSGDVYWLTTMAPDETSPSNTRYRFIGGGQPPTTLFCYVSFQFAPLYDPNDISLIQQPDALEMMTQALSQMDSNDYGGYQTYRNSAITLLRKDRRGKEGTDSRLNVQVRKMPLKGRNFSLR